MKLARMSARNLASVVDAYDHFPDDPVAGLRNLLEIDDAVAKELIDGARLLGVVTDEDEVAELASLIRTSSLLQRRDIIRVYLERFEAYAEWKRKIAQGFEALAAARHVKVVFEIEDSPAAIRDWFIDLGTYTGSMRDEGTEIALTRGATPDIGSLISDVLNRQESAIEVLSSYLGEALWLVLSQAVRDHLMTALTKLANNEAPDEVVRESGMAMDKYMEELGETQVGGYAGRTMGQSANALNDDELIVKKQTGFTAYGVNIRNAAEHPDTDVDLGGDRWTIGPQTAVTYLRVVLDFIRSANAKQQNRFEL